MEENPTFMARSALSECPTREHAILPRGEKMKREKHAEWWASPPKLVGPLVVILFLVGMPLCGFFVASSRFQEAILTCAAGSVFILVALLDLVAELIRYQKLILDRLENQELRQDQGVLPLA
jgi:hypothetical protein